MKSNLWSSAASNGFLLALITIIVTLFTAAFPMGTAASLLIQFTKLTVTIGVLYYFMKKFGGEQDSYTFGNAFTYGFVVSLCSNIVIACYSWLHYTMIFPDSMEKTLEIMQQVAAQYNLEQHSTDLLVKNFPIIMSVGPLIIYTFFGLIFAAILANFAKKADPPFINETES